MAQDARKAHAEVTLVEVLRAVRERLILVLLMVSAGMGLAGAYLARTAPAYEAQSEVFISASDRGGVGSAYTGGLFTQQRVRSYAQLVTTQIVTSRVAASLGDGFTADSVAQHLQAAVNPETIIVTIRASCSTGHCARRLADAAGREFVAVLGELEAPTGGVSPVRATIVSEPREPQNPSTPRPVRVLLLGLLSGLSIGVVAALARAVLDRTVRNSADLEEIVGSHPLGVIAEDKHVRSSAAWIVDNPLSRTAEAFRRLRTNLRFVEVDRQPSSLVVTSALPGEGKTTVAVNLATSLAAAGVSVVLVDADFRKPAVAPYLGLDGSVGVTSVLVGDVDLDSAIQVWSDSVAVLPSGPRPPNPGELLGSSAMAGLLAQLAERHTLVIIDTPPLLAVGDAAVVGNAASGALLVVRHGSTTRDRVRRALDMLAAVDTPVFGAILNRNPTRGPAAEQVAYGAYYGSERS